MSSGKMSLSRLKLRRRRRIAAALGFVVSAVVLLAAMAFFQADRPVQWPPSSAFLYLAAFAVAGTAAGAMLWVLLVLLFAAVDILRGQTSWRDFRASALMTGAVAATLAVSVTVSLNAFYRPWALASAARTASQNPPKWRLITCGRVLSWGVDARNRRIVESALYRDPGRKAAAAYALAAAGEADQLGNFVEAALLLPVERPDGASAAPENDIASQADAQWLLERLFDGPAPSIADLDRRLAEGARPEWDAARRRYALPASGQGG